MTAVRMVGTKDLKRNLTYLEKQVFPRATANALNRTANRGRKNSVASVARMERRKKKAYRSIIRVVKRARAVVSEQAIVAVFRRGDVVKAKLSEPFRRGGKVYRRRIPGRKHSVGRPATSSKNLPIYPERDNVRDRRESITRRECGEAMRSYYPQEVRAQIKRLSAKLLRRSRR